MSFSEPWQLGISPLRFVERTCRPTPLIIMGSTSLWVDFLQADGDYSFQLCLKGRNSAFSIYILLQNAPKVPYWAKLGDFWRGIIPLQGG